MSGNKTLDKIMFLIRNFTFLFLMLWLATLFITCLASFIVWINLIVILHVLVGILSRFFLLVALFATLLGVWYVD